MDGSAAASHGGSRGTGRGGGVNGPSGRGAGRSESARGPHPNRASGTAPPARPRPPPTGGGLAKGGAATRPTVGARPASDGATKPTLRSANGNGGAAGTAGAAAGQAQVGGKVGAGAKARSASARGERSNSRSPASSARGGSSHPLGGAPAAAQGRQHTARSATGAPAATRVPAPARTAPCSAGGGEGSAAVKLKLPPTRVPVGNGASSSAAPSGAVVKPLKLPSSKIAISVDTPRSNLANKRAAAKMIQSAYRWRRWKTLLSSVGMTSGIFCHQAHFRPLVDRTGAVYGIRGPSGRWYVDRAFGLLRPTNPLRAFFICVIEAYAPPRLRPEPRPPQPRHEPRAPQLRAEPRLPQLQHEPRLEAPLPLKMGPPAVPVADGSARQLARARRGACARTRACVCAITWPLTRRAHTPRSHATLLCLWQLVVRQPDHPRHPGQLLHTRGHWAL